jgi:hypothetical protein
MFLLALQTAYLQLEAAIDGSSNANFLKILSTFRIQVGVLHEVPGARSRQPDSTGLGGGERRQGGDNRFPDFQPVHLQGWHSSGFARKAGWLEKVAAGQPRTCS